MHTFSHPGGRRPSPGLLALLGGALIASPVLARAEDDAPSNDPAAPQAVGRVFTAGPGHTAITLLSSGGYGYTESVLGMGDAHHRVSGALSVDGRPLPWLDLQLRLDGRYDAHVVPGQPTDSGLVGDPRLYVRADRALGDGLRLGARAGVWLAGRNAPSLDLEAISPELVGAVSYVQPHGPLGLTANVGYRLDRSARSAADADRLSPGDRLALEVSAFNEVLLGVAATVGRGRTQGFLEGSWELLVGGGHPSALKSPIVVGGGARFALGDRVRLEVEAEVSPSSRPDVGPTAPLVPIPPRVAAWLGLSYRFGTTPTPAAPPPPPAPPPEAATPAPPPSTTEAHGHVAAADGGKLADLRVAITLGDQRRDATVDEAGRFSFEGKPGEEVTVTAEATGYLPARATLTLEAGPAKELTLTLQRRPPRGQLRGLIRSLKGSAVVAEIQVEPETAPEGAGPAEGATMLRAEGGRFEVEVAPGRYRVTITAAGYDTQKRRVEVEDNGVTLLNVDLRSAR